MKRPRFRPIANCSPRCGDGCVARPPRRRRNAACAHARPRQHRPRAADKRRDPPRGRRPASTSTSWSSLGQRQRLGALRPDGSASTPGAVAGHQSAGNGRDGHLRGKPGRGIKIDLPRRIVLHSLTGGEVSFDDVASDLPSLPRLDSTGESDLPIRRTADGQRRCRRRLSRRPADQRRLPLTWFPSGTGCLTRR